MVTRDQAQDITMNHQLNFAPYAILWSKHKIFDLISTLYLQYFP